MEEMGRLEKIARSGDEKVNQLKAFKLLQNCERKLKQLDPELRDAYLMDEL